LVFSGKRIVFRGRKRRRRGFLRGRGHILCRAHHPISRAVPHLHQPIGNVRRRGQRNNGINKTKKERNQRKGKERERKTDRQKERQKERKKERKKERQGNQYQEINKNQSETEIKIEPRRKCADKYQANPSVPLDVFQGSISSQIYFFAFHFGLIS